MAIAIHPRSSEINPAVDALTISEGINSESLHHLDDHGLLLNLVQDSINHWDIDHPISCLFEES